MSHMTRVNFFLSSHFLNILFITKSFLKVRITNVSKVQRVLDIYSYLIEKVSCIKIEKLHKISITLQHVLSQHSFPKHYSLVKKTEITFGLLKRVLNFKNYIQRILSSICEI